MKKGFAFIDLTIIVILAIASGYLACNIILVLIPQTQKIAATQIARSKTTKKSLNNDLSVVYKANIFDIEIKQAKKVQKKKKIKVVSNISGYRLIGFVASKDPMVLFKKQGKPVVIVTKHQGLDGLWLLYRINPDSVDLKNKKTGEIKRFKFKQKLSNIIKNFNLPKVMQSSTKSGSVEKIVVPRTILSSLTDINRLFNQVNITPAFSNGKPIGYRINFLSGDCVLRKAGLRVGDIIVSVNGQPTTDPQKIMGMFSQLSQMTSVSIDIIRGGVKKTIFVEIQ